MRLLLDFSAWGIFMDSQCADEHIPLNAFHPTLLSRSAHLPAPFYSLTAQLKPSEPALSLATESSDLAHQGHIPFCPPWGQSLSGAACPTPV